MSINLNDLLPAIKSNILKNQTVTTLNRLDHLMSKTRFVDGLKKHSFGHPLLSDQLRTIELQEHHQKALKTRASTLGEWISEKVRGTIENSIEDCRGYSKFWGPKSNKVHGCHEIENILLHIHTIIKADRTRKPNLPPLFCKLCYRHSYQNGNYCEKHSPERNNKQAMKNYRKNTRLLQRAAKHIIKTKPHTELLFGDSSTSPDIEQVWNILQSWMSWKYPDSASSKILNDDTALSNNDKWRDWAIAFDRFIHDLPRARKHISNTAPLKLEDRSAWLSRIYNILDNYPINSILKEPQHLIASFARFDQYLLIQELGERKVGRPIKLELRSEISKLRNQGLSYSEIGKTLNISKARAGKIGKELNLQ